MVSNYLIRRYYATPLPFTERLRRADQMMSRCNFCGEWTNKKNSLCRHCDAQGYPMIDDVERTA